MSGRNSWFDRRSCAPADDDEGVNQPARVQPDPALALLDMYDAALPQVYGYLLSRCRNAAVAEDLTAEAFLAAVGSARAPGAPTPSIGWLIGIARHKIADHWRRLEREQRNLRLVHQSSGPDVEDPWDERIDSMLAREVLDGLAPQHRAALTLRYLDGLPVPEVAALLDRTVHATEALLVRARREFRDNYPTEEGSA